MRWLDSIIDSMDMNLQNLWEIVKERKAWYASVHRVTKSQTCLSDQTIAILYQEPLSFFLSSFFFWLYRVAAIIMGCRPQDSRTSVVVALRPQSTGSVVVMHGLSCPTACGILPNETMSSALIVDSLSLSHQGSSVCHIIVTDFCVCCIPEMEEKKGLIVEK